MYKSNRLHRTWACGITCRLLAMAPLSIIVHAPSWTIKEFVGRPSVFLAGFPSFVEGTPLFLFISIVGEMKIPCNWNFIPFEKSWIRWCCFRVITSFLRGKCMCCSYCTFACLVVRQHLISLRAVAMESPFNVITVMRASTIVNQALILICWHTLHE